MKIKIVITVSTRAFLMVSCGKQTAPPVTPDQPAEVNTDNTAQRLALETDSTVTFNKAAAGEAETALETVSDKLSDETVKPLAEPGLSDEITAAAETPEQEPALSIPIPAEETPQSETNAKSTVVVPDEESTMVAQLPAPPQEIQPALTVPDSSWQLYMIAPGDFLIRIAKHEYGDWQMWRKIYRWNRDEIGDNPNLIFPYHNLDLLKPREEVQNCEPEFRTYTVKSGDNLWTIAGQQFNDERAWIVLFWDNEELLDRTEGVLKPGMDLKVRTNCIPLPE
ncbi:MAG: LysM peptidoglycan-binding domain-containing protein [Fidelibacterota bacterium]